MTYKVSSTTVIGSDGKIDWARLKSVPSNVLGAANTFTGVNCGYGTSVTVTKKGSSVEIKLKNTNCNCNCDCK